MEDYFSFNAYLNPLNLTMTPTTKDDLSQVRINM